MFMPLLRVTSEFVWKLFGAKSDGQALSCRSRRWRTEFSCTSPYRLIANSLHGPQTPPPLSLDAFSFGDCGEEGRKFLVIGLLLGILLGILLGALLDLPYLWKQRLTIEVRNQLATLHLKRGA